MESIPEPEYQKNDKMDIAATQVNFEYAVSTLSSSDYRNYKSMALYIFEKEDRRRDSDAVAELAQSVFSVKED